MRIHSPLSTVYLFLLLSLILLSPSYMQALGQAGFNVYPEKLSGNVIRVGATVSLSGEYSIEGSASLCGLKAAIDWVNSKGGVEVGGLRYMLQLVYQDDGSDPSKVKRLYQALAEEGVSFYISPYGSYLLEAAEAGIRGYPAIMYSYTPVPDRVFKSTLGDFIVSVASSLDSRADTVTSMIAEVDPAAGIGVFYIDNPYGVEYLSHITSLAEDRMLRVVYQRDYGMVEEVTDAIYSIKANKPDVLILVPQSISDSSRMTKAIYEEGVSLKLLVIDGVASFPIFYTNLSAVAAENIAGISEWEPGKGLYNPQAAASLGVEWYGPSEEEILEYHRKHCIIQPNWISMGAAASIILLAKALEDSGSLKFIDVKDAITRMSIMTFYGLFDVDEEGKQVGHKPVIIQWREGDKTIVYPESLRESKLSYPASNWWRPPTPTSRETVLEEERGLNLGLPIIAAILAVILIVIVIVARRR